MSNSKMNRSQALCAAMKDDACPVINKNMEKCNYKTITPNAKQVSSVQFFKVESQSRRPFFLCREFFFFFSPPQKNRVQTVLCNHTLNYSWILCAVSVADGLALLYSYLLSCPQQQFENMALEWKAAVLQAPDKFCYLVFFFALFVTFFVHYVSYDRK